jgi:hypothetical protein
MKTTFKTKVKNVVAKGKNLVCKAEMKALAALTAIYGAMGIAYCETNTDINSAAQKVLDMFFGLITFAGIIMTGVGIIQFIQWALAAKEGQAQPGQMAKALGMFFGGLVCALLKTLLGTLGLDLTVKLV